MDQWNTEDGTETRTMTRAVRPDMGLAVAVAVDLLNKHTPVGNVRVVAVAVDDEANGVNGAVNDEESTQAVQRSRMKPGAQ